MPKFLIIFLSAVLTLNAQVSSFLFAGDVSTANKADHTTVGQTYSTYNGTSTTEFDSVIPSSEINEISNSDYFENHNHQDGDYISDENDINNSETTILSRDGETILDFNNSSNLGISLSGEMTWNGNGGGHLYCESYNGDDYINFSEPTYVNNFQMNHNPWQGYTGGSGMNQDIYAYDENGNTVWSTTVNLSAYQNWSNWLTVEVNTTGITQLRFVAPGQAPHNSGFWPSIDNLSIGGGEPPNTAPTATAQSVTGNEDSPQTITLTGSDAEGDALTYALATNPSNGTVSLNGGIAPINHSIADFVDPDGVNIQLSLSNTGWEGTGGWDNGGIYVGPHVSVQPDGFNTPDGDGYFVRNYTGQSSSKYAIT